MWKSGSFYTGDSHSRPTYHELVPTNPVRKEKQKGNVVAAVGTSKGLEVENIYRLDNELLGYNLSGRKVLLRVPQNDSSFDHFVSLPFTKGVTERETGRTMIILGSNAHHVEAMQYQFQGVLWMPPDEKEVKKFGDTVRWINVGDTKNGFIGLDYNSAASVEGGVARNAEDVHFLAQTLLEQQFDPEKRLFLLKPPYIQEREEGKALRTQGLERLGQIASTDESRLARILNSSYDIGLK
ncbi:MAG: hypothetical protein Q8Q31_04245 [Nanoarchaeota archaeon]|nr:hypothetical protein [Nanoarchaeota archaeon]